MYLLKNWLKNFECNKHAREGKRNIGNGNAKHVNVTRKEHPAEIYRHVVSSFDRLSSFSLSSHRSSRWHWHLLHPAAELTKRICMKTLAQEGRRVKLWRGMIEIAIEFVAVTRRKNHSGTAREYRFQSLSRDTFDKKSSDTLDEHVPFM